MKLGTTQRAILAAVKALHPDGYGVSIQDHVKANTGNEPSTGSVYAILDRFEDEGLVETRMGAATPGRVGKRKMHFTLTEAGKKVLENQT